MTPYEQRLWDKWMDSELADLMKEEYAEKVAKYFIKKHREYVKEKRQQVMALGHQQDDDQIWCEMDKVLDLLD